MPQHGRQSISVLLTLLALSCCAFSQAGSDTVSVSLSAKDSAFSKRADAKIKVKVMNASRQTLKLDSRGGMRITLSKPRKYSECHWSDCFSANISFRHSREIKPAGSLEIDVDLADQYWNDIISSQYDFRQPENMFVEVPSGSYHLFVTIAVPVKNSTGKSFSSNQLLVTVDGSSRK
jgi:hypothetical protein